jgi:hypothetical protein
MTYEAVLPMTSPGTRSLAVLALALMLLGPGAGVARGQSESAKTEARGAMREGNALLEHGRPEEALGKFEDAYRLFPSPKLHYNLGQAHSRLPGHEAQAYEELSRFLNDVQDANPSLRAAAETQRRQLRAKVALLTIVAEPADSELLVDGVSVGAAARGTPLPVTAGTHKLTLTKGGVVSDAESVTVGGGDALDVRLSLRPRVGGPRLADSPPPLAAEGPPGSSSPVLVSTPTNTTDEADDRPVYRKAWFWGVVGGAVVAAAVGGFLLLRSSPTYPTPSLGTYPGD